MWLLVLLTWLYYEWSVQNIGASKHALLLGKYYEIVQYIVFKFTIKSILKFSK